MITISFTITALTYLVRYFVGYWLKGKKPTCICGHYPSIETEFSECNHEQVTRNSQSPGQDMKEEIQNTIWTEELQKICDI